jgi:uncharacterized protein YjiS (DUF1127 family)
LRVRPMPTPGHVRTPVPPTPVQSEIGPVDLLRRPVPLGPLGLLRGLRQHLEAKRRQIATCEELMRLPDRELADIGFARQDLRHVARTAALRDATAPFARRGAGPETAANARPSQVAAPA